MALTYQLLSTDDQDDILVAFLHAQERDHFCYSVNAARYQTLSDSLPAGDFKTRIDGLLVTETAELAKCEAIITETVKQLPDKGRIDAAEARRQAKVAAAEALVR